MKPSHNHNVYQGKYTYVITFEDWDLQQHVYMFVSRALLFDKPAFQYKKGELTKELYVVSANNNLKELFFQEIGEAIDEARTNYEAIEDIKHMFYQRYDHKEGKLRQAIVGVHLLEQPDDTISVHVHSVRYEEEY